MDRSAAIDIPGASDRSPQEKDSPTDPGKKKRGGFQPLRSIKKFFSGKKKDKKETGGVTGLGITSTSCDELETRVRATPDGHGPHLASKSLSMSADSVFTNDKIREENIDFTVSMNRIHVPSGGGGNQGHFKDELARKLVGRRGQDDEGYPASPPGHLTTIDAIMENGLKEKSRSMDSEHSLMSMDSAEAEMEEDFFQSRWPGTEGSSQNEGPVNLDVVASTTSLNTSAARHKIAIKPKTKRSSAMMGQRRRAANSPKPPGAVAVMPQLREESPPKTSTAESEEDLSCDLTADTSHDRTAGTDIEELDDSLGTSPLATSPLSTSPGKTVLSSSPAKTALSSSPKPQTVLSSSPAKITLSSSPGKSDVFITPQVVAAVGSGPSPASPKVVKSSDSPAPVSPTVKEVKAEPEVILRPKEEILRKKDPEAVVMRPDSSNRDSSKRQTVAIGSVDTVFGERKVKRTSMIAEGRDWDNVGKPKDKSPEQEEPAEGKGSEFASVFAKFRRNASTRKTNLDHEADKLESSAESKRSVFGKASSVGEKPKVVNVKPGKVNTDKSAEPAVRPSVISLETKSHPKTTSKTVELKPAVATTSQNKSIVIPKSNEFRERKDTGDSAPAKRNSTEVKRDSLEVVKKRNSAEKSPRDSLEKSTEKKRDSGEKTEKRNSGGEAKAEAKKDCDSNKAAASEAKKDTEEKTVKVSKFVSVQQKSVPLNDKKSEPVSSKTSEPAKAKSVHIIEKSADTKSSSIKTPTKDTTTLTSPDSSSNKRESPRPTNRFRSQTLPETGAVTKETTTTTTAPKRANSTDKSINKENIPQNSSVTKTTTSSVVTRTAGTKRPEPSKLSSTTPTSGGVDPGVKGQPSWVKAAKKHTGGWEDRDLKPPESKQKKEASEEDKNAKRASVLDLMKRFQ